MRQPISSVTSAITPAILALARSPYVVFLALSLAIVGPLMQPGHLLTVDSPIALNQDFRGYFWGISDGPESVFAATYNSAPIAFVHSVLALLLPSWLVERLWLVLLFWLAGVGASRLPYLTGSGGIYAGVFYAVNPFPYSRFIAGQWGVLGAYALTPFLVTHFVELLDNPSPRVAVKVALLLTAIGLLQIHGLLLAILCLLFVYVFRIISAPGRARRSAGMVGLALGAFIGLNAFWMVRFMSVPGGVTRSISLTELGYFAAKPPIDVVTLRGFWLSNSYLDISDLVGLWWVLFAPLMFLAVLGVARLANDKDRLWLMYALLALGILCMVLAAGPSISFLEPAFRRVWETFPTYAVFRDSHKFISLAALMYTFLGGVGIQEVLRMVGRMSLARSWLSPIVFTLLVGAALSYGLPLYGGFGQIKPSQYPEEWVNVKAILDADDDEFNLLVLPWHMYLKFPWLHNRFNQLANPAPIFFSQPTISGDNIQAGATETNSSNLVSKYVEGILSRKDIISGFGSLVAPLNSKYVVLLKVEDYPAYRFLDRQTDLERVFDGEHIALYRNLAPVSVGYFVDDVVGVRDVEEFLKYVAETGQSPLQSLYVIGPVRATPLLESSSPQDFGARPIIEAVSPITYEIRNSRSGFAVVSLPQHVTKKGWRYEGREPLLNLGMTPAFAIGPGNEPDQGGASQGSIVFATFWRLYVPLYIVAFLTLAMCGSVLLGQFPVHNVHRGPLSNIIGRMKGIRHRSIR